MKVMIMAENEIELKTPENKRITNQRYEQNTVEHLTVRVPKGKVREIKEYVKQKRKEEMYNPIYQSVNSFVIGLIEEKTGLYVKGIYQEVQNYENEREAYNEWLNTDPLHMKNKTEEMLADTEFQEYLDMKLKKLWKQVGENVVRDYVQRKSVGE